MSLEPPTTARVTLHTTKGSIKIALFAKELPLTSLSFLQSIYAQDFTDEEFELPQGTSSSEKPIMLNFGHVKTYDPLHEKEPSNGETAQELMIVPKELHPRIKCKRGGYLAISRNQWMISMTELSGVSNVVGKIYNVNDDDHDHDHDDKKDSWFVLKSIADGEKESIVGTKDDGEKVKITKFVYPVKITGGSIDVPFFEMHEVEKRKLEKERLQGLKRKNNGDDKKNEVAKKKSRVVLTYDDVEDDDEEDDDDEDEDEGRQNLERLKVKSIYDKPKQTGDKDTNKKDIIGSNGEELLLLLLSDDDDHGEKNVNQNLRQADDKDNYKEGDSSGEGSSEEESDLDSEEEEERMREINRDPTIDSKYDPYLDLKKAESITYQQLKTHKFNPF